MATWPVTLPQAFRQEGFKDTEPALFLRTEMDAGPPKIRRRFTAGHRLISGSMIIDATQKAALRTFFRDYGASENTFQDPDNPAGTVQMVFMAEPSYESAGGGKWQVNLQMAVLP